VHWITRSRDSAAAVFATVMFISMAGLNPAGGQTVVDVDLLTLAKAHFGYYCDPDEQKLFDDVFRNAEQGEATDRTSASAQPRPPARTVMHEWLEWLCIDSKASARVSSRGIRLAGVQISGTLNLSWAKLSFPLSIYKCEIPGGINMNRAIIRSLSLRGSKISKLDGDGLTVERDILLSDGFTAVGEVWLRGARIGGDLTCQQGHLTNPGEVALTIEDATIGNSVLLSKSDAANNSENIFEAKGRVILDGAVVHGALDCHGGRFDVAFDGAEFLDGVDLSTKSNSALDGREIDVKGSVLLTEGFAANGTVLLRNAMIGKNLDCTRGTFTCPYQAAIDLTFAQIGGEALLGGGFEPTGDVVLRECSIAGELDLVGAKWDTKTTLDLTSARARTLRNTVKNRKPCGSGKASMPNEVKLHGFTFDEFDIDAELTASAQLAWIHLQTATPFKSQPYEQVAKVFRDMGLEEKATDVMVVKNRDHGEHPEGLAERYWYGCWRDWIVGYGYRPWHPFAVSLVLVLIGANIFRSGWESKNLTPNKAEEYEKFIKDRDTSGDYPTFVSLVYSLETFVPLLKLEMGDYWTTNARRDGEYSGWRSFLVQLLFCLCILFLKLIFVLRVFIRKLLPLGRDRSQIREYKFVRPTRGTVLRWYFWFHVVAGWVLTSLWLVGLTGLMKT
jgi:hypothetical protein